jgi:hypothetical protein
MLDTLDGMAPPGELVVRCPYFNTGEPLVEDEDTTYTGDTTRWESTRNYVWLSRRGRERGPRRRVDVERAGAGALADGGGSTGRADPWARWRARSR